MIAAVFFLWLLFVGKAGATDVTFCVKLDKELTGLADDGGGDFWTSNTPHAAAAGLFLSIAELNSNPPVLPFNDYTHPTTGCTGALNLDPAKDYVITSPSHAEVEGGNFVFVYNNTTDDDLYFNYFYSVVAPYEPPSSGPVTVDLVTGQGIASDVLAIAIRSVNRYRGGLTGETFEIYAQEGTGPSYVDNRVLLDANDHKYVVAHEIGHVVAEMRDEGLAPLKDYGLSPAGCYTTQSLGTGHEMACKEWQSTSAMEGWANFYSSAIWNDVGQSDCRFVYWGVIDWDLDGTDDETSDGESFVCVGDPCTTTSECANPSYLDDADWLLDLVGAADSQGCTTPTTKRTTEYDFMRLFWTLMVDDDLTPANLLDIYDAADPNDWDPNAATGTTDDDPQTRLLEAADDLGFLMPWFNEAQGHGTHR